jgi:hypothetical protein
MKKLILYFCTILFITSSAYSMSCTFQMPKGLKTYTFSYQNDSVYLNGMPYKVGQTIGPDAQNTTIKTSKIGRNIYEVATVCSDLCFCLTANGSSSVFIERQYSLIFAFADVIVKRGHLPILIC